jgi:hypothetical protein
MPSARNANPTKVGAHLFRSVRLDDQGVVRWTDDNSEVRLLGTNYSPMSAHDYITVGFYAKDTEDRHKAIYDRSATSRRSSHEPRNTGRMCRSNKLAVTFREMTVWWLCNSVRYRSPILAATLNPT